MLRLASASNKTLTFSWNNTIPNNLQQGPLKTLENNYTMVHWNVIISEKESPFISPLGFYISTIIYNKETKMDQPEE